MNEVTLVSFPTLFVHKFLPVQEDGFAGSLLARCCTFLCTSQDLGMLPIILSHTRKLLSLVVLRFLVYRP